MGLIAGLAAGPMVGIARTAVAAIPSFSRFGIEVRGPADVIPSFSPCHDGWAVALSLKSAVFPLDSLGK